MNRSILRFPLAGTLFLAACVSSGTKVTTEQIAAFEVGKTTEEQVIAALGKPNSVTVLPDGSHTDVYLHTAAHATAATYVPIVGLFAGGAKGTSDTAIFMFDAQHILKSTSSNTTTTDVKTGIANQ